ncbi:MAG: divalent-cation tolerance protein CutA [Gemmatimonadota bacterium]
MGDTGVVVVLVTGPDATSLEALAGTIVGEGLAACVNLIPRVRSVYRWDGEVHRDDEALAVVKTTRPAIGALRDRVHELHPYDLPEFLVLPIEAGSDDYLAWVAGSVAGAPDDRGADGEA